MALPKTLQRFASKIESFSDERASGDGYWVYLKRGWKSDADPLAPMHQIHENTITACAQALSAGVLPCDCQDCTQR